MVASNLTDLTRLPHRRACRLDRQPGFWRGRAWTCRQLAAEERRLGHLKEADDLDRKATKYELKAEALVLGEAAKAAPAEPAVVMAEAV